MSLDRRTAIHVENFKAFGPDGAEIPEILPINVIIGRNNAGKSALLDAIHYLVEGTDLSPDGHRGQTPLVALTLPITQAAVDQVFPEGTYGGQYIPGDHRQFGHQFVDKLISLTAGQDGKFSYRAMENPPPGPFPKDIADRMSNPFRELRYFRLLADRDIKSEPVSTPSLQPDGVGATSLIQHFLNDSTADQDLVERDLLDGLNRVFAPDSTFTRIQTKWLTNQGRWEIYLEEEGKGPIALSSSGSGLKTVILVLCNLILMPRVTGAELADCIFAFEELENNLHPGLQRRLLQYMEEVAVDQGATFFLTTHSNVAIDRFSSSMDAQIIHVTHDGTQSSTTAIIDAVSRGGVLDDLDVRASDLFQANAVVWVEGPSDRVYMNAILQKLYNGQLREGAHYQCVFYGGRLLARLGAGSSEIDGFIDMLNVNRHCVVVMDRDTFHPNKTKRRIRGEVERVHGITWTTRRKEIECDMPVAALEAKLSITAGPPEALQPYDEYLDTLFPGAGRKYLRDKVGFAQELTEHMTQEMIDKETPLREPIHRIANQVAAWNQIELT